MEASRKSSWPPCRCIRRYFGAVPDFNLRRLWPSSATIGCCALVSLLAATSEQLVMRDMALVGPAQFVRAAAVHVTAGVCFFAALIAWLYHGERASFAELIRMRRAEKSE